MRFGKPKKKKSLADGAQFKLRKKAMAKIVKKNKRGFSKQLAMIRDY